MRRYPQNAHKCHLTRDLKILSRLAETMSGFPKVFHASKFPTGKLFLHMVQSLN